MNILHALTEDLISCSSSPSNISSLTSLQVAFFRLNFVSPSLMKILVTRLAAAESKHDAGVGTQVYLPVWCKDIPKLQTTRKYITLPALLVVLLLV